MRPLQHSHTLVGMGAALLSAMVYGGVYVLAEVMMSQVMGINRLALLWLPN